MYFINLYELFDYNLIYKISKLYNFILKLNSDQNYIILFLIFFIITIYNNLYVQNLFVFYFFFTLITINLKFNLFDFSNVNFNINKNLLNGLLIIHPIILYTSYGMMFYLIYYIFFIKFKFMFYNNFFFVNKQQYLNTVLILLLSIFLGSWWAEQELSWGGWWSWDFIEIISLNFFFILLFLIHMPKYKIFLNWFEYDFFIKILIFMVIVRFNFLNSIHNFISNNFFFQFFYELIIIYCIFSLILINYKLFNLKIFKTTNNLNFISIFFFIIIFNLLIYLYLEFICLMYKELSLTGLFKKNKILYYFILYFYIMLLFKSSKFNMFFLTFFEHVYCNLYFYNNYKSLKLYLFHVIIFISIFSIFFNFYFIDQNNFILHKNITIFNLNDIFFNNGVYYISDTIINNNFNNSIFFKFNFFTKNVFLELFSFNKFMLFIININILFYLMLILFILFFKLIFKKSVLL